MAPTMDADRIIDWAQARGMGVDVDFRTGRVVRTGAKKQTFPSAAAALAWARSFAENWGLPTP